MFECAKMNGNGNDFIAIDNMNLRYDGSTLSDLAVNLCRRKESIGGDGILVAEPSQKSDFRMRIFNRDGSEGEMCGNGARCMARFAYDRKITDKAEMSFETLAGEVSARVNGGMVSIDMSPVSVAGLNVDAHASLDEFDFDYAFLTVGVPHTVIFQKERDKPDEYYAEFGRKVRYAEHLFSEGTNVNFVFPREKQNELFVLTYERGVEELTLSCGTGSTASAIVSTLVGLTGAEVDVWNPGGLNRVSLSFAPDDVVCPKLEGRVMLVCDINLREDALR